MDNLHNHTPNNGAINVLLILSTIIYSFLANWITNLDIILSIITKILPVITFCIYIIINHEKIIINWAKFKNRIKSKLLSFIAKFKKKSKADENTK